MQRRSFLTALAATLAGLTASPAFPAPDWSKDTLVTNVNGLRVAANGEIERFTGLIVNGQGKVETVLTGAPPPVAFKARIDGRGQTLLPGMIDAHGHVIDLGFAALRLDLTGTKSLAELQQRLRDYAAAHPDAKWILGSGWNQELWPDKRFPTAADLDAVVGDRPVVLDRVDGHAIIANSAAMKAAGVTSDTAAPSGGRIENGLFVDAAQQLIGRAVPKPSPQQVDEALAKAQDILLANGVTGVGSMSTSLADWQAFRRAGAGGQLNVRLMTYLIGDDALAAVPKPTEWLYGDRLRAVGVKLFADGALGSRGAWLKQPYADKPDTRGLQFHSDAEILALAENVAGRGFQVATHAIGDAANVQVIGVYEQLSRKYGRDRRWRIEHFQIVDPADISRLAPAGIIASMQPTHQTSDRLMAEARLGKDRLAGAYAWQSVLKSGARLAFGTDFPVESPNPFPGLAAGISRQDSNGEPAGGWLPQERLTLAQALGAYTRGAAFAGFAEAKFGSLEPGTYADFILVDRDPTKVDPQALARTEVLQTFVSGKKVWERAPSASPTERGR